ncbi:MAG: M23 family metallopeptidase [Treponema sp.]|jgi:murein DD-endopeptidase MepM/ murein hydrolase activator NlpD|nr:M23 family metallopeptidase [Treponema sp.]
MDRRKGILGTLLLFIFSFSPAPELSGEEVIHVVEKGETIYSIARSFHIDPGDLMRLNNISDASRLQAGKRLWIPLNPLAQGIAAREAPAAYQERRVLRNETLYSIARNGNTTVEALREINGFSADHVLREGELIRVPVPAATATENSNAAPVTFDGSPESHSGARQTTVREVDRNLRWPVTAKEIVYMDGKLPGVMVAGERAEPVRSLIQGTVVSTGSYRGFGGVAIVQVAGGYLYVYGGCESLSVKAGDRVSPGTEIGKLGIDAVSGKPQLFFIVFLRDSPVDPSKAPRA